MNLFFIKSIIALFFLAAGITALISMLTLMGKVNSKLDPKLLRKIHKTAGFTFFILLIAISIICLHYVAKIGDALSLRAVLHSFFALALFIILVLKIMIVRFYEKFLKFAPQLGMTVFILAFIVFSSSAGFYFLTSGGSPEKEKETSSQIDLSKEGNRDRGKTLFQNKCQSCHLAESEKSKVGPGLKNLFKKERLPYSQNPATVDNVLEQLESPARNMPSFSSLSESELANLFAYLKTL